MGGCLCDGCYLQLSESVVTLLLARSLLSAHGDELIDAVCNCPVDIKAQRCKSQTGSKKKRLATKETERNGPYRAAAASWFLRLGELGSVDRALAASSSLLDDMEIVFRLDTTCVWSSFDWRRGE